MTLYVVESYDDIKDPDGEAVVIPFAGEMDRKLIMSALEEIEDKTGYGGFAGKLTRIKIKEKKK